jgi:7,8-dihydroneopterin aldolase/epimerase/oxygenase
MDRITIEALQVDTIIGIHTWEKSQRQTVLIDIDLMTDIRLAAGDDSIADTVHYGDIARCVTEWVAQSQLNLIETMAEQIADLLLSRFLVASVIVKVSKPGAIKNAANVSVTIERTRP